jgi:hypothetical protein
MVIEGDFLIDEIFGVVDEPNLCVDVVPNISSSNMENLHLETTILLENEVLQLIIIKVQVVL